MNELEVVWVPPAAGAPEPILKAFLPEDGGMRKYCAYHRTPDGRRYFRIPDSEENRNLVPALGPAWWLAETLARKEAEDRATAERLAKEEAEAERLKKEEADRLAREEAERLAREEAERLARAEAEREAADKKAAEEAASSAKAAAEAPPIDSEEAKRVRVMAELSRLGIPHKANMKLETLVQRLPVEARGPFL